MTIICENCGEKIEGKVSEALEHKCKSMFKKTLEQEHQSLSEKIDKLWIEEEKDITDWAEGYRYALRMVKQKLKEAVK